MTAEINKVLITLIVALLFCSGTIQAQQNEAIPAKAQTEAAVKQPELAQLDAQISKIVGGSVQYSNDAGKNWVKAELEAKLGKDSIVRTGFASTCEISFRGNTLIQVEALSSVRIAEYLGNENAEKVDASLQYGAVRCGVEKGKVKSDTKISTSVAVLAIRGTITFVEYDRGTGACELAVVEDGPADAITGGGSYSLAAGMSTDANLSRHLQNAIFGRSVFVTGSRNLGDVTDVEAEIISLVTGGGELGDLSGGESDDSGSDDNNDCGCPDGECDPGPTD